MKKILITFALLCTTLFSYSQVAKSEDKRSYSDVSLTDSITLSGSLTDTSIISLNGHEISFTDTKFGLGYVVASDYVLQHVEPSPDGGLYIGGQSGLILGVSTNDIVKLTPSYTIDPTFASTATSNGNVKDMMVQSDNKLVVAEYTGVVHGTVTTNGLVRLNTDGSLDAAFNTNQGTGFDDTPQVVLIQSDGKILVGGDFTSLNGNTRNNLVRLNSDGTEDVAFYTNLGDGFDGQVRALAELSDGSIIIGGDFASLDLVAAIRIVKVSSTGVRDAAFDAGAGIGFSGKPMTMAVDGNDDVYIGGQFLEYDGVTNNCIIKIDGTSGLPDATFNTGTGLDDFPRDIKILENGNLMVAGVFENYKGSAAPGAFEVTTLGTVVSTFNIGTGFTAGSGWQLGVHGFAEYNGSIVFAGTWNEFNGNSDSKDLIQLTSGGEVIEPLNFEFKASGSGVSTTGDFSAESVETTGGMTSGGIIGLTDWTVGPDDGTFATEREGFVLRDTSSVFNRRRLNIFDPADEINALDFRIGADGNSGMFRMESWIYPTSQTYASMSVIDYNNTGEAGYYLGADGSSSSIHRWYTRDNDGTASTYLGYNGLYSTHVTPSEWDNTYYITKSYGDTAYAETPHTVYIAGNLLSIVNDTISADSAITAGYEGLPWTTTESSRTWYSTAISNDGKYVTAGYGSGGYLHTSDDYGATWTQRGVSGDYRVMDISSTGQYQTAGSSGSYIYTSNDYGVTWTQRGITGLWRGMGLSSSGQYQTGAIASGYLYTSNDYGVTWTQRDATRDWRDIDVSGTGQLQVAAGNPGVMRYSNDYGVTWSDVSLNYACGAVSMSSNGKYMIAARIFPNESYYSDDYGVTWSEGFEFPENVQSLAMSSSGKYVIATTFGNYVFNSNDYGKTWTQSNYSASWRDGAISDLGKFRVAVGGGTFINLQLSNTTANINAGFIYNSSDKFNINSLEEVNIYSPFINFNDSIVDTIYSGTIPNTDWVNAEIAEAITGGLTFTGGIQEATDIVSLTSGTLLQDFELTGSFDWGFYHAVDNYYHGGVQVTPSTGTVDITSANATWKRMQINSNGLNWRYWEPYLVGSTNRDHNMEIDNAGFDLQLEELGGRGATAWETRMSLGQTNLYIRSFQSGWEGIRLGGLTVSEQEALGDDYVVTKEYVDYTSPIIINVQGLSYNPADGVTRYFGMLPRAPVTTASSNRIYIRENGTLTAAEIFAFSSTAGSAEGWSLYVRLNNTTDYLIATVSAATNERSWTNTSLSVPLVAGDYITIKCVQPTWATNPNGTIFGGYITIK